MFHADTMSETKVIMSTKRLNSSLGQNFLAEFFNRHFIKATTTDFDMFCKFICNSNIIMGLWRPMM